MRRRDPIEPQPDNHKLVHNLIHKLFVPDTPLSVALVLVWHTGALACQLVLKPERKQTPRQGVILSVCLSQTVCLVVCLIVTDNLSGIHKTQDLQCLLTDVVLVTIALYLHISKQAKQPFNQLDST